MSLTAIALSGGIDSLVAASLLIEKGHNLIGIHFATGFETVSAHDVEQSGKQIGIRTEILDCAKQFRAKVVDNFLRTYRIGQTPNPCLICNAAVKFGIVRSFALKLGADRFATGHYARVRQNPDRRYSLLKGADLHKDQSYFLAFLDQEQLQSACFPLGNLTKAGVRTIAEEKGIFPAIRRESQDICFIRESYRDFLQNEGGFSPSPGPITDTQGRLIGEHQGLHFFTVGQRRGISCPASEPYYVVRLDTENNRLVVGFRNELLCPEFRVRDINWISPPPSSPLSVHVRVRYRHNAVPATVFPESGRRARVCFEKPHPAVTPGQGAVFYRDEEVLGGGWIEVFG